MILYLHSYSCLYHWSFRIKTTAKGIAITITVLNSPDKDVVRAMEPYKEIIDAEANMVIGSTNVYLNASSSACRKGECNMGNFIANAFVEEVT
jgi:5'-nucleotidase